MWAVGRRDLIKPGAGVGVGAGVYRMKPGAGAGPRS